jgi:hypothetical protein
MQTAETIETVHSCFHTQEWVSVPRIMEDAPHESWGLLDGCDRVSKQCLTVVHYLVQLLSQWSCCFATYRVNDLCNRSIVLTQDKLQQRDQNSREPRGRNEQV